MFERHTVKMIRTCNILFFASVFIISHGQQLDPKKIELADADKHLERNFN